MRESVSTLLVVAGLIALPPMAAAGDLNITVNEVLMADGAVFVAIYGNKADFRKKVLIGLSKPAELGKMQFKVNDLAAGEYAIMVFHDINGNGELDKRLLFGIPKEPWGGSMNGNNYIGPPGWGSVNFQIPEEGKSIVIEMK